MYTATEVQKLGELYAAHVQRRLQIVKIVIVLICLAAATILSLH